MFENEDTLWWSKHIKDGGLDSSFVYETLR